MKDKCSKRVEEDEEGQGGTREWQKYFLQRLGRYQIMPGE